MEKDVHCAKYSKHACTVEGCALYLALHPRRKMCSALVALHTCRRMFSTLQRTNTENLKQIFPEKELRGHSLNFHIHVPVSNLYIPIFHIYSHDQSALLQEVCGPILRIYKSLIDT
jgi:hypothetical protein